MKTEERDQCLQIEGHYLHSGACLHQHQEQLVVQEGISTEAKIRKTSFIVMN